MYELPKSYKPSGDYSLEEMETMWEGLKSYLKENIIDDCNMIHTVEGAKKFKQAKNLSNGKLQFL
jgi:hypothetical protein